MGYRRIRDELDGHKGIHVNDKRVLRICRKYDIKSNIKWKPKSCTRGDRNPDHIAKNYLHREFHAEKPNEKWLTDVSEFKYYNGIEVHKVYLSAILDLSPHPFPASRWMHFSSSETKLDIHVDALAISRSLLFPLLPMQTLHGHCPAYNKHRSLQCLLSHSLLPPPQGWLFLLRQRDLRFYHPAHKSE